MRSDLQPADDASVPMSDDNIETAIFTGSCCWCMELSFENCPEYSQSNPITPDGSSRTPPMSRFRIPKQACRNRSGRDQFPDKAWGSDRNVVIPELLQTGMTEIIGGSLIYRKLPNPELRTRLTPLQYSVTQEEGTERPFSNEFWDNSRVDVCVDVASGEPLFSSHDKFKSGTGWQSFTRPLDKSNIVQKVDRG